MGTTDSDPFIGRDAEVVEVCRALSVTRLITLTGVGGVGKTRLAAQVAAQMSRVLRDGVCRVELAAVSDPALVGYTVAAALGIGDRTDRPMSKVLREHLAD